MTGPINPPAPSGALTRRFDQMFPVLTSAEITRVRSYGDVHRFQPGELLARVGKPSPGMYVILSGRLAVVSRDPLGRAIPVAEYGRMIGGTPEEMEVLPGEFLADLGTLTEKPSALDVQAVEEVEAIVVPPDQLRA
jgi:thioredoxin reductase (NADPH)